MIFEIFIFKKRQKKQREAATSNCQGLYMIETSLLRILEV